ncbi:hypothetical protein EUTSA_v10023768mg [Eutrema salsugineum]|uniref:Uncharacterized protein n=1 Tax=Eutrema salsugineum TaxID=72664 RepID=V4KEM6_EUTSA|nr:hypothetical protein EUTSA_v10023768mg [Eutrema salsugineum]
MVVSTAIRGGIILAKLSVIPVRRDYWGNKIGTCGSVTVRMVPAPRAAGIVAARIPKKDLPKRSETFSRLLLIAFIWKETRFSISPYLYTDILDKEQLPAAKAITEVEDQA